MRRVGGIRDPPIAAGIISVTNRDIESPVRTLQRGQESADASSATRSNSSVYDRGAGVAGCGRGIRLPDPSAGYSRRMRRQDVSAGYIPRMRPLPTRRAVFAKGPSSGDTG